MLIPRLQQTRWNLQEAPAEQVQDEDEEIVLSPGSAISAGREKGAVILADTGGILFEQTSF